MSRDEVAKHYENPRVKDEIVSFAKGRWVGLHCTERDRGGRPHLLRYLGRTRLPLKIEEPNDVAKLLKIFKKFGPRTFYATANVYKSLKITEDVMDLSNISACTPTWDIDNTLEKWQATLEVVKEIIAFLEQNGVERSSFIKWSGKGCHMHIHGEAVSEELRRRVNPLDLAYAVVEYVNAKLREKYTEILIRHGAEGLRVDNEMDPQRLFTCPLSLHKELEKVCVCINKTDLDNFTPEWAAMKDFRHYDDWKEYTVGEADELAMRAYEMMGPSPSLPRFRRRRHPPLDEQITHWIKRFQKEG